MDEMVEPGVETAGERLRAARVEKGLSLEDIAAQTRIPLRHLESLEAGEWSKLPAPTYTIGFARSYAGAVGLDRTEVSDQLRGELGGGRPNSAAAEIFEPADPARTMPKWLVFGTLAAVLLLALLMSYLSRRSLDEPAPEPDSSVIAAGRDTANPRSAAPTPPPAANRGPVVITANEQVWIQVKDGGSTLREAVLDAGQSYEVPATATAPVLATGKPEALRISVGTADAPPVGPAATTVRNVSLRGPDLLRGPAAAATGSAPAVVGTR
jgi:cytoskeletal protein RodZ